MVWPAIIAGIASLVGSGLAARSSKDAAQDANEAAGFYQDQNIKYQKEFAQQGIRWRVEDARAAGLHPLAALGMSPASYSPSVPAFADTGYRADTYREMGKIGQDLTRAISAKMSAEEREVAQLRLEQERARLKGLQLDNASKEREMNATPAMPAIGSSAVAQRFGIAGQDDGAGAFFSSQPGVTYQPKQLTVSAKMGTEAGIGPLEQRFIDKHGRLVETYTQPASEPMESSWFDNAKYAASKVYHWGKGLYNYGIFDNKNAAKYREFLRMDRPAAYPGYEFRYNPYVADWILREKDDQFDTRLYDTDREGFHFGWESE